MNVYDFDKTIYKKDCSIEFYLFVIKKNPMVFFKCFPMQVFAFFRNESSLFFVLKIYKYSTFS